jgi:AraC-like DNA-binding protein
MASAELGISSAIVAPVLRALEELGLDLASSFPAAVEEAGQPFVRGELADRTLDHAAEKLGDAALGITLARRIPIGALGLIDYALCTSASLRDALRTVARHYAVATQRVRLELEEHAGQAALSLARDPRVEHSRHWMEFSFAILAERMRATLGSPVTFDEVAFKHAPPASAERHDDFFGVQVRFGQPSDRLAFAARLLERPLQTASRCLAELLDERFRELEPAAHDPFLARVQRAIVDLLDQGECSLGALAAQLRTSPRTLQRKLTALGTSHRDLLDDVRRERSQTLLRDSQLSVTEVAARLGFSETSAFFRAFRRWTGTSPQMFRLHTR